MLQSSRLEPVRPRGAARTDAGDADESTAELLAGVANEARHLGEAYFELLRFEAERSLRRGAWLLAGGALFFVAALLAAGALTLGLVENTDMSLGGSCAVAGAIVLALGLAVVAAGSMRSRDQGHRP